MAPVKNRPSVFNVFEREFEEKLDIKSDLRVAFKPISPNVNTLCKRVTRRSSPLLNNEDLFPKRTVSRRTSALISEDFFQNYSEYKLKSRRHETLRKRRLGKVRSFFIRLIW